MKDCNHDGAMAELFRADQSYVVDLLTEAVRDGNADELAIFRGSFCNLCHERG